MNPCKRCDGLGELSGGSHGWYSRDESTAPCPDCGGSGEQRRTGFDDAVELGAVVALGTVGIAAIVASICGAAPETVIGLAGMGIGSLCMVRGILR